MLDISQISAKEKEDIYLSGAAKFRKLASEGKIEELVEYVFHESMLSGLPYGEFVPSKSRLSRNALNFFIQNNDIIAIEKFFSSPFIKEIKHEDIIDSMRGLFYKDNIEGFKIIEKLYKTPLTELESTTFLELGYKYGSSNIISTILDQNSKELSQEGKLNKFIQLLSINSNNISKNSIILEVFNQLELKYPDLLYHQEDDVIMRTAFYNQHTEVVNYLLFTKKLRITKHINALSYGDSEFANLLQKRKLYDSMLQKSKNALNLNEKISLSIEKNTPKKLKI